MILPDEHVFICGATGSGKTVLAKSYLSRYDQVIVLDCKGTFKFEPFLTLDKDYVRYETIKDFNKKQKFDKIVYRPNIYENNVDFYDKFFEYCYNRRNTIVLIDEAMSVCTSYKIPFYYKACLTRGRELGVSCWNCTQRPSGVNQLIMTESMHWFIFRLNAATDRKKLVECSGNDLLNSNIKGHDFIYYNADKNNLVKSRLNFQRGGKRL